MHDAAFGNDTKLLEEHIKKNVPIDSLDKYSRTPLLIAAQESSTDVIRILLSHGANVNKADEYG
ncbi:ankyrin repeat domain-containing protein [Paenibacillus sp. UNC499MF]|uniref:ankyrin repeat domain-containing protein n=1 Tax=Paenibacillus sp. UNC499MF TaxID=1502751 RepID=UPI0035B652CD